MAKPSNMLDDRWEPERIRTLERDYLFQTYRRFDLFPVRGDGAYVVDVQGKRYLDFLAGIAVNALGYNHPRIVRTVVDQAQKLIHCSNLFYHPYQGLLARRLANLSGMSRVFFTNSGAEAMEAALKIARAFPRSKGLENKTEILALENAFHGRTFGALSLTPQEEYQAPFRPLVPGVTFVDPTSPALLREAFSARTCALVLEPIQGEGGVIPLDRGFMKAARELCSEYDALLVVDEIQSGLGRTGELFAFQHYGIQPDLVTLAKSLAAGYPLGAVLGNDRVAESLTPGQHGTTFGGGPLACRLALEFLDIIDEEKLLDHVRQAGQWLLEGVKELMRRHPIIQEVRGVGLMVGIEIRGGAANIVSCLLDRGVIANVTKKNVLRLLPPLIISQEQIDEFLSILDSVLDDVGENEDAHARGVSE